MYLIFLISSIQIVFAAEIISFSATVFNIPTITNDSITLNVELSNCSSSCLCHVQMNKTGGFISVNFLPNCTKGFVTIKNLNPYTLYSFDLNCSEVINKTTYSIRTDVFRPSSPQNTQLILDNKRLQLKWMPPSLPQGPIDEYRVIFDKIEIEPSLNNTVLSYTIDKDYVAGIKHTMNVIACNIDSQNRNLCSNPKDSEVSYFEKNINSITPTQSACINISNSITVACLSLFLFCHKIK